MSETLIKPRMSVSEPHLCDTSELSEKEFVYEWSIQNFQTVLQQNYEIVSPVFSPDKEHGAEWKLVLFPVIRYPKGLHLAVSVVQMSHDEKPSMTKFSLSLVDKQSNIHRIELREKIFKKFSDSDECTLLSHAELIEKNFLPGNCLTLRCEMNIVLCKSPIREEYGSVADESKEDFNVLDCSSNYKVFHSVQDENKANNKMKSLLCLESSKRDRDKTSCDYETITDAVDVDHSASDSLSTVMLKSINHLSDSLKELYNTKHFSDITVTNGEIEIRAHRAILSARSHYFKKICAECKSSTITLNVSSAVMENVFYYIYSGKVRQMPVDMCLGLLHAARQFRLFHLQELVIHNLKINMTVGNISDILEISEELKLQELKYHCLKYMNTYHPEILGTNNWHKMVRKNPHIAGEALLTIASFQKRNIL